MHIRRWWISRVAGGKVKSSCFYNKIVLKCPPRFSPRSGGPTPPQELARAIMEGAADFRIKRAENKKLTTSAASDLDLEERQSSGSGCSSSLAGGGGEDPQKVRRVAPRPPCGGLWRVPRGNRPGGGAIMAAARAQVCPANHRASIGTYYIVRPITGPQ
jgi:hypothetical protein